MKNKILFSLLTFAFIFTAHFSLHAETATPGEEKITFHVRDSKDSKVYLTITFREKLMLVDSAFAEKPGIFTFQNTTEYQEGMYSLVSEQKKLYLNFIVDKDKDFTFHLDTTSDIRRVTVEGSPENSEMLRFQHKNVEMAEALKKLTTKKNSFNAETEKDSIEAYDQKIRDTHSSMLDFIDELIAENPSYLFSKLQKSFKEIELPEAPLLADGKPDQAFQYHYYMNHFWDNFDLADQRTIYLPSFEPKVEEYFKRMLWNSDVDTLCKYADIAIAKATDTVVYRFFVEWLSYQLESSKVIGHDKAFVHIAKNNQLKGKCTWMDEELIVKYEKRVKKLEPLLIGQPAVELIIPDTTQSDDYNKWISSHKLPHKYVILWFYDPECGTCKKESKQLKLLYDSVSLAGTRNFEVYGVSSEADINRWKKYLREMDYSWINVGGMKANVDYLDVYNIYELGNPQMYILNEKREIILNKRIDMFAIPQFLERYEELEKAKQEKLKQ